VRMDSHPGHVMRVYTYEKLVDRQTLLLEYTVSHEPAQKVTVIDRPDCAPVGEDSNHISRLAGLVLSEDQEAASEEEESDDEDEVNEDDADYDEHLMWGNRSDEFEGLVKHCEKDGSCVTFPDKCHPTDQSHLWSCFRKIPREICDRRHKNDPAVSEGRTFGFQAAHQHWEVGSLDDDYLDGQLKDVPKYASDFLKMDMPKQLREELITWFEASNKDEKAGGLRENEEIQGHARINNNKIPTLNVDIEENQTLKKFMEREMRQVLSWWSQMRLFKVSTFGVRIYQRGAVMLSHVADAEDEEAHVFSAVMQISQRVDDDRGWPLEVTNLADNDCYEVYLQPGEMILYESLRVKHGRPMAFEGQHFANLFVAYAPWYWAGKANFTKTEL